MRSPSVTGEAYPACTPRTSQRAPLSVSTPVDAAGTAASIPISLLMMFSSLWLTMTSSPTTSAAVLRPRLLTSQFHTGSPVASFSACMAPSLPPEKNIRVPLIVATKGLA